MKNILFVKKKGAIPTDEVLRIFEGSNDLNEIRRTVEGAGERIYATWASVDVKDKAGEIIPIDDLAKQQEMLLERNGPIMDEHSNRMVGQTLAYKILEHPEAKELGVLHLNKIFDMDNQVDDQVWKEIKSGERQGSSVGGYNTEKEKEFDDRTGSDVEVLRGFTHMETSSVYDPCNPLAKNLAFAVVAKSNQVQKGKDKLRAALQERLGSIVNPERFEQLFDEAYAAAYPEGKPAEKTAQSASFAENVIKEASRKECITTKGDKMDEETKDAISELTKSVAAIGDQVAKLKKQDAEVPEEEEPEAEDKKKADEEDKPEEPEEKKKAKKADEEEAGDPTEIDDKKKENASDVVEGNQGTDAPESPKPEESNEDDVFKKMVELTENVDKKLAALSAQIVDKSATPRPLTYKEAKKTDPHANLALDLATGKKKGNWMAVHKAMSDDAEKTMGFIPGGL